MPRLTKGALAVGIAAKSREKLVAVRRRVEKFIQISTMQQPPADLLKVFCTAESLAEWHDPALGISPLSVKTLRKHFAQYYPEGLAELCAKARELCSSANAAPEAPSTQQYKLQTERAIDSALEMTARYLDLLERIKKLSVIDNDVSVQLRKHLEKFGSNPHIKVARR